MFCTFIVLKLSILSRNILTLKFVCSHVRAIALLIVVLPIVSSQVKSKRVKHFFHTLVHTVYLQR